MNADEQIDERGNKPPRSSACISVANPRASADSTHTGRAKRSAIGAFALAVLLAGCSTLQVGHDFDTNAFESRVQRGVTTREQVRDWLGAPTNTGIAVDVNGNRDEEWTYYFAHGRLPSMANAKFKSLQVRFNSQGKVVSYSWSSAAPEAKSGGS